MSSKIVVVTGASKGLGASLVKEFAANDWQVVGTGRSPRSQDLLEEVAYQQFDASDAAACEAFWQRFAQEHSDAEVCLVNNAGSYVSGGLLETGPEEFEKQMQSCYFTSVYMTRGLAKFIPKARIINIISSSALAADAENPAYGAAKAAQSHFFQALQQEFEPEQYQIINLYPSYIATHEPDPDSTTPEDLATFVREQAELKSTYYLREATIYPAKP